jgi:hypothetical protein
MRTLPPEKGRIHAESKSFKLEPIFIGAILLLGEPKESSLVGYQILYLCCYFRACHFDSASRYTA